MTPTSFKITDKALAVSVSINSSHGQKGQEREEGEGSGEDCRQNGEKGFKEVKKRRGNSTLYENTFVLWYMFTA